VDGVLIPFYPAQPVEMCGCVSVSLAFPPDSQKGSSTFSTRIVPPTRKKTPFVKSIPVKQEGVIKKRSEENQIPQKVGNPQLVEAKYVRYTQKP
jgi:hypothetical protein